MSNEQVWGRLYSSRIEYGLLFHFAAFQFFAFCRARTLYKLTLWPFPKKCRELFFTDFDFGFFDFSIFQKLEKPQKFQVFFIKSTLFDSPRFREKGFPPRSFSPSFFLCFSCLIYISFHIFNSKYHLIYIYIFLCSAEGNREGDCFCFYNLSSKKKRCRGYK